MQPFKVPEPPGTVAKRRELLAREDELRKLNRMRDPVIARIRELRLALKGK